MAEKQADKDVDYTFIVLAAQGGADTWLCADSVAVRLGMFTPGGEPNRRGFYDRVACRSSFPKPLMIGSEKKWKASEIDRWAEDERKISRAA